MLLGDDLLGLHTQRSLLIGVLEWYHIQEYHFHFFLLTFDTSYRKSDHHILHFGIEYTNHCLHEDRYINPNLLHHYKADLSTISRHVSVLLPLLMTLSLLISGYSNLNDDMLLLHQNCSRRHIRILHDASHLLQHSLMNDSLVTKYSHEYLHHSITSMMRKLTLNSMTLVTLMTFLLHFERERELDNTYYYFVDLFFTFLPFSIFFSFHSFTILLKIYKIANLASPMTPPFYILGFL